jgi:glutaminyl-tRNA synthetase
MRNGEIQEGGAVLRAKIDMASPNVHMRDPIFIVYCIQSITKQVINGKCTQCMTMLIHYQMQLKALRILCTLEFQDHRPFYDWVVEKVHSKQYHVSMSLPFKYRLHHYL